jgi:hypothetical protein
MGVPQGVRGYLPSPVGDAIPQPVEIHDDRLGPMVPLTSNSPNQWIATSGMMLRVLVGSTVHGTAISGQDDRDEMGICVEPPQTVVGLRQFKHYEFRTQPEGVCSGPGDLDLIVYSLRRYASLAAQGNPTVLLPLFVPDDAVCYINDFGRELREKRDMFLSKQCAARFKGYLHSQREGLMGLRSGGTRNQGRADIRAKYGFDCYLDDTEFLTRRGWKTYDLIADGEPVATVNQVTGEVEFQVPTERVSKPYDGPIHHFRHRYSSCSVTPNHRMWSSPVNRGPSGSLGTAYRPEVADWAFHPAGDLAGFHHVRVVGKPRAREYPVSDAVLNLVGCYLSEGHVTKRRQDGSPSVLGFSQNVGGRLEPALAAVGAEHPMRAYTYTRADGGRAKPCEYTMYTLADRELAIRIVDECGTGSLNKHLPSWALDLSSRQAEVLLAALMAGDGTLTAGGWQIYYSVSERLAGGVQALAVLAGRRSNVWGPYVTGMYQVMVQDPGREFEAISTRVNMTVEQVADRRIVCFSVPNETLVTRREGRVAMHGNTKFAMHMVRLGVQGRELLQTGTITLPMPSFELEQLRALRRGERSKEWALAQAESLEEQIDQLMQTSTRLPDQPDWGRINSWLIDVHRRHWRFQ